MEEPKPGQFYMVEVNQGYDPLLKRAFSLFRRTADGIQILYRIQGKGTAILRNLKEGAVIRILGPLGNGYPAAPEGAIPVIVAGGIGIASVFPLIEGFAGRAYVLYGARTGGDLFMLDELSGLSKELHICTDDGSCSERGNVVGLLDNLCASRSSCLDHVRVYACGPKSMLREAAKVVAANCIRAWFSLEEHMACGVGACLGCVTKIKSARSGKEQAFEYQRVCKEGPVFDAEDIVW